jgi:phosphoheptose isomerase
VLNIENMDQKFHKVVQSDEWNSLQIKFNQATNIYVLGHGGNLGIADHAAVDITRLSNGTKNAQAPGSAIVDTSLINDTNFDQWMVQWVKQLTTGMTLKQKKKSLILGISSSGTSRDLIKALQWGYSNDLMLGCITAHKLVEEVPKLSEVILGAEYYHTAEVLSLLLTYELTHGSGKICPPIGGNTPDDIKRINSDNVTIKEGFSDELKNIAVDFDGVLHKNSKGFYDGTIYDEPVDGARESLKKLSKNYDVVIFSAKSKPDRGLVDGKTGTQLVWEWLEKHKMSKFVTKVTEEKPRAIAYIDDKSIEFDNWEDTWKSLQKKGIVPWDTEWTDGRQ